MNSMDKMEDYDKLKLERDELAAQVEVMQMELDNKSATLNVLAEICTAAGCDDCNDLKRKLSEHDNLREQLKLSNYNLEQTRDCLLYERNRLSDMTERAEAAETKIKEASEQEPALWTDAQRNRTPMWIASENAAKAVLNIAFREMQSKSNYSYQEEITGFTAEVWQKVKCAVPVPPSTAQELQRDINAIAAQRDSLMQDNLAMVKRIAELEEQLRKALPISGMEILARNMNKITL